MSKHVKINNLGRRIGEDHPNAKLTDAEVDMVHELLEQREDTRLRLTQAGYTADMVRHGIKWLDLDNRSIAALFNVSHMTIHNIATGRYRSQTCAGHRTVNVTAQEGGRMHASWTRPTQPPTSRKKRS